MTRIPPGIRLSEQELRGSGCHRVRFFLLNYDVGSTISVSSAGRRCRPACFSDPSRTWLENPAVPPFPLSRCSTACITSCLLRSLHADKTRPRAARGGRKQPTSSWAAESRAKWGPPARFGIFPNAGFLFPEMSTSSCSKKLLAPQGEETGEERNTACIPYILHCAVPFGLIRPTVESSFPSSSSS